MRRDAQLRVTINLLRSMAEHAREEGHNVQMTPISADGIADLLEELLERRPNLRLVT
jgi:hypothetical protein